MSLIQVGGPSKLIPFSGMESGSVASGQGVTRGRVSSGPTSHFRNQPMSTTDLHLDRGKLTWSIAS